MKTLDVSQATAAAHAGGVLSAILKADGDSFYVELETRSAGTAVLVTSNNRRPRAFRNPVKALEVIRELGLQTGRFSLEAWRPDEVEFDRHSRPDRAEAMKATHASAAAYDKWVRQQVQEAIDDPRPTIAHGDVMKKANAHIETMRKSKRAKTEWKVQAENDLFDLLDYIGQDDLDAALRLVQRIHAKVEGLRERPTLYRVGRIRGTREMTVHRNYVVFYRASDEAVTILRVKHARQQWP